eukprot:5496791-Amphidinium_carterae.1
MQKKGAKGKGKGASGQLALPQQEKQPHGAKQRKRKGTSELREITYELIPEDWDVTIHLKPTLWSCPNTGWRVCPPARHRQRPRRNRRVIELPALEQWMVYAKVLRKHGTLLTYVVGLYGFADKRKHPTEARDLHDAVSE